MAVAPSAGAAESRLAEARFRLALIDYHLPDGKGVDLLDAWRQHPDNGVAVIITGDPDPRVHDAVLDAGATLVRKSILAEELDGLIAMAVEPRCIHERLHAWLLAQGMGPNDARGTVTYLSHRSTVEAAATMGCSKHSVRDYVRPALQLTGARNKAELLQVYLGLLDRRGARRTKRKR